MYIKIINPKIHGKTTFSNTGSCKNLVDYLSKENEKLPLDDKELFFNHQESELSSNAVIKMIDTNIKGIAKERTKFHSLVIAPDSEELRHIRHSPETLKRYTCEVMKEYARGFNLKNGKTLNINDLVWAAKLERERNGESNNGNNMHVHVIVSARDYKQSINLSPNVNNKQRFSRVQFCLKSEQAFDQLFHYKRIESRLRTDQIIKHGSLNEKEQYFTGITKNQTSRPIHSQKIVDSNLLQSFISTPNSASSSESQNEYEYKRRKLLRKKRRNQGPKL